MFADVPYFSFLSSKNNENRSEKLERFMLAKHLACESQKFISNILPSHSVNNREIT